MVNQDSRDCPSSRQHSVGENQVSFRNTALHNGDNSAHKGH